MALPGIRIEGDLTGNVAEVDASGSLLVGGTGSLTVNSGKDTLYTGYQIYMSENDPGNVFTVNGKPHVIPMEVSEEYRVRVGWDTLCVSEVFNYSNPDYARWRYSTVGAGANTHVPNSDYLKISPNATTTNIGAMIRTCKHFPLMGAGATYIEWSASFVSGSVTNNVMELGAGLVANPTASLADGICFRWDLTGSLRAVINYNGTERLSVPLTSPAANAEAKYVMAISDREVEFWIDDVLQTRLSASSSVGSICAQGSLYAYARCNNSGAASSIQELQVSSICASRGDYETEKSWGSQTSGGGNNVIEGASGFVSTSGSANIVNAASASVIVPASGSATAYPNLGGEFKFAPIASAETDYSIFAYQVPTASVDSTARTLYTTGISIFSWLEGLPMPAGSSSLNLQWSLGIGSTSASLTTTDLSGTSGATGGTGRKAPRRTHLGVQFWPSGSVAGTLGGNINCSFAVPYVVNSGEYLHIIVKMPIATAVPEGEWVRGAISLRGYWA